MTAQAIRECELPDAWPSGFAMLRASRIAAMGAFTRIALLALAMEWSMSKRRERPNPQLAGARVLTVGTRWRFQFHPRQRPASAFRLV